MMWERTAVTCVKPVDSHSAAATREGCTSTLLPSQCCVSTGMFVSVWDFYRHERHESALEAYGELDTIACMHEDALLHGGTALSCKGGVEILGFKLIKTETNLAFLIFGSRNLFH